MNAPQYLRHKQREREEARIIRRELLKTAAGVTLGLVAVVGIFWMAMGVLA